MYCKPPLLQWESQQCLAFVSSRWESMVSIRSCVASGWAFVALAERPPGSWVSFRVIYLASCWASMDPWYPQMVPKRFYMAPWWACTSPGWIGTKAPEWAFFFSVYPLKGGVSRDRFEPTLRSDPSWLQAEPPWLQIEPPNYKVSLQGIRWILIGFTEPFLCTANLGHIRTE